MVPKVKFEPIAKDALAKLRQDPIAVRCRGDGHLQIKHVLPESTQRVVRQRRSKSGCASKAGSA